METPEDIARKMGITMPSERDLRNNPGNLYSVSRDIGSGDDLNNVQDEFGSNIVVWFDDGANTFNLGDGDTGDPGDAYGSYEELCKAVSDEI